MRQIDRPHFLTNHSGFSDLWKAFTLKFTTNLSFFFSAMVLPPIAVSFAVRAGDCKLQNALWFWLTELINKYRYQEWGWQICLPVFINLGRRQTTLYFLKVNISHPADMAWFHVGLSLILGMCEWDNVYGLLLLLPHVDVSHRSRKQKANLGILYLFWFLVF